MQAGKTVAPSMINLFPKIWTLSGMLGTFRNIEQVLEMFCGTCPTMVFFSPTSQIIWLQQHFCPPHLPVLACISTFPPPTDSSGERVALIRNPILFDVNRDVDLIHFFCNYIWVVSCALWWTFIAQTLHIKTTSYSVLFWFRVPENKFEFYTIEWSKLIVLLLIIESILNRFF